MKTLNHLTKTFARNYNNLLFGVFLPISILLLLTSSTDPVLSIINDTPLEGIFINSLSGNSIVFNLSMGFIVSTIFYLFVVYVPERHKANEIKPHLDYQMKLAIGAVERVCRSILMSAHVSQAWATHPLKFEKDELLESCEEIEPMKSEVQFQHNGIIHAKGHGGQGYYNDWSKAIQAIEKLLSYKILLEPRIINSINALVECNFGKSCYTLRDFHATKETNMKRWGNDIWEAYQLAKDLEKNWEAHS